MKIEAIKARFESGNQFPVTKALLPKEEFDWLISEIERLQSLATTAMEQHDIVGRLYQESVKEIERLHEEIRTEQRLSCREQVLLQQGDIERNREAMRQALVALEGLFGVPDQWTGQGAGSVHVWNLGGSDAPRAAITALKGQLND